MWLWRVNVGWGVRGEWSEGGKEEKKKEKKRKREKGGFFVCESGGMNQPSASRPCKKALHGQEALFFWFAAFLDHDDRRQAHECVPTAGAHTSSCL
jgi:hypothetical protein